MLWEEFFPFFFAGLRRILSKTAICWYVMKESPWWDMRLWGDIQHSRRGRRCDVGKENAEKIHHIMCNLNDVNAMWAEEICSKFLSLSRSAWLNPKSCNLDLTREIFVENSMNSRTQFCTFYATLEFNTPSHSFSLSLFGIILTWAFHCMLNWWFLPQSCMQ